MDQSPLPLKAFLIRKKRRECRNNNIVLLYISIKINDFTFCENVYIYIYKEEDVPIIYKNQKVLLTTLMGAVVTTLTAGSKQLRNTFFTKLSC